MRLIRWTEKPYTRPVILYLLPFVVLLQLQGRERDPDHPAFLIGSLQILFFLAFHIFVKSRVRHRSFGCTGSALLVDGEKWSTRDIDLISVDDESLTLRLFRHGRCSQTFTATRAGVSDEVWPTLQAAFKQLSGAQAPSETPPEVTKPAPGHSRS